MKNLKGFSLIEVLIATALISVVGLGIAAIMRQSIVQTNYVKDKVEFNAHLQLASNILGKPNGCDCNFTGLVFDSTDPNSKINIPFTLESCSVGANMFFKQKSVSGLARYEVQDLYLAHFKPTGNADEYMADLLVTPSIQGLPQKAVGLPVIVNTLAASPNNAKVINACGQTWNASPPTLQVPVPGNAYCILSWTAVTGEAPITYHLKQSAVLGQAQNGTLVGMTTALGYMVTGLTFGVPYYFAVQGTNVRGATAFSNEQVCIPRGAPCTTPWGTSILDGTSVTAYFTNTGSCQSETRTCTNGTLSGTYPDQVCKPYWHCSAGTRPAASGRGVADVTWIAHYGCTCNSPGYNYTPAIGTSCSFNSFMSGGNNHSSCVYSCTYY